MGGFGEEEKMTTNFLTNRTNLTILQCILYLIVGYIMNSHLTFKQMCVMYIILLLIQGITRVKALTDGMIAMKVIEDNLNKKTSKRKP